LPFGDRMPDQFYENITNIESILEMIRYLVDSRTLATVEFPGTRYTRIISFLGFIETARNPYLLVDKVKGIEVALKRSPHREVSFEFRDGEKVPCLFKTEVIGTGPEGILVKVPKAIQRIQKREYYRVETPLGSEITFSDVSGKKETEILNDLSGKGLSFLIKKGAALKIGDVLRNIRLNIPQEKKILHVEIPRATIRNMEPTKSGRILVGVDFAEIAQGARDKIISYVFERHRSTIRKVGR